MSKNVLCHHNRVINRFIKGFGISIISSDIRDRLKVIFHEYSDYINRVVWKLQTYIYVARRV